MSWQVGVIHFAMGLMFFAFAEQPGEAVLFFTVHALCCLALGHRRPGPRLLLGIGGTLGAAALLLAAPPLALLGTAAAAAAINVALSDGLSFSAMPMDATLTGQAWVAAGNGAAPLLWTLRGTDAMTLVATVAAIVVVALAAGGTYRGVPVSRGGAGALGVAAVLAGLAIGVQVAVLGAIPDALGGSELGRAITIGGAVGVVTGRGLTSRIPRLRTRRVLRAALSVSAAALLGLGVVPAPPIAAVVAFVVTAALGPLFPLALSLSYPRNPASEGASHARGPGAVIAVSSLLAAVAPAVAGRLEALGDAVPGMIAVMVVILVVLVPRDLDVQRPEVSR